MSAEDRSASLPEAALPVVLVVSFLARAAYTFIQPGGDPMYAQPILDGKYYLAWARTLGPPGAPLNAPYYLGPLYPWCLAAWIRLGGASFPLLYLAQQALVVATAYVLATVARRSLIQADVSPKAAAAGAAVTALGAAFYHPGVFFASRPLSEPLGLLLVALALAAASRSDAAAGALSGLAALARPAFLLVPLAWTLAHLIARRWRGAALLAAGAALAVAPATIRNAAVSGRLVPVSANSGVVLWLGNAPGAVGVYTPADGFSGALESQQAEAVALASERTGRRLDAVDADRYWRHEALRVRLADPLGTIGLVARRAGLTLANAELGLDDAPRLDGNPVRRVFFVPFALIAGLAAAGFAAFGARGTGGTHLLWALAAVAATPLLFYVSSRHRLPVAMLLAVPAGAGAIALAQGPKRGRAIGCAAIAALISLSIPAGDLVRAGDAAALANRGAAWKTAGDLAAAERDLDRALALDPASTAAGFNRGVVLEAEGRAFEAERAYRAVLAADPGHAEAAGNLAGILVRRGTPAEAVPVLREALRHRPASEVCWTNLVVALAAANDRDGARRAARAAAEKGVGLPDGLARALEGPTDGRD